MRFKSSIVVWLIFLVSIPVAPLFCFALYSAERYAAERQSAVEAELAQRAGTMAQQLHARLERTLGYLNGLALSDAARQGDVAALYSSALRVKENNLDITGISLIDQSGKLVFLTLRPLGTPLPTGRPDAVEEVFKTKRPVLSEPFNSPVSNRLVIAMGVPIFKNGEVAFCIRAIFTTDSISSIVKEKPLPDGWIAGVVSGAGTIVGRSRGPEYIGQKSLSVFEAIVQRREGTWDSPNKEGVMTRALIRPIESWNWFVAIGVPTETLNMPLRSELLRLAGFGAVLLCLALIAVVWMSNHITRGLKAAVDASQAMLTGGPTPQGSTGIQEIDQMRESLMAVDARGKLLEQRVSERTQALEQANMRMNRFVTEQERIVEAERQRISREVHDQIGSVLTGLKMIFRSIPKGSLPDGQEAAFLDAIDLGVATARRIASELRPSLIDDLGLQAALQQLLENTFRNSNIAFSVHFKNQHFITERQTIGTFRIIQEACTNIVRHASAITVQLVGEPTDDGRYRITLRDDGVGLPTMDQRHDGLGFVSMRERAELLGGTLVLEAQAEGGTRLILWLPLADFDSPSNP